MLNRLRFYVQEVETGGQAAAAEKMASRSRDIRNRLFVNDLTAGTIPFQLGPHGG